MPKAYYISDRGYVVVKLPPGAQVAPAIARLLEDGRFQKCGSEFQQHYRVTVTNETDRAIAEAFARSIKDKYNTGKKIYTRQMLVPPGWKPS